MAATDEELIEELRRGDIAAFDQLYARYERRLFGYIRRMTGDLELAEDLFQDVVLKVLSDRTYDPRRGRFSAWVFTVARNRCAMDQRKRGTRAAVDERRADGLPFEPAPEESYARRSRVRAAMAGLPEGQQQLLLLKQVGELTYDEIATMLGVAQGTIKSRIHAAMRAFRQRFAELGGEP